MSELARIEPKTATAEELLRFAVAVREQVDSMTEQQLDELEATLVAVEKRLQQLGKDAAEARRSRVITLLRIGQLLGRGKVGRPKKIPAESGIKIPAESGISKQALKARENRRRHARLLAEFADQVRAELGDGQGRVEVKRKRRLDDMIYVELMQDPGGAGTRWKPSGLNVTDAEWWAFAVGDTRMILFIPTDLLRWAVSTDAGRPCAETDGDNPTEGRLFRVSWLIQSLQRWTDARR